MQRAAFGWLPKGYTLLSVGEDHQNGAHTFNATAGLNGGQGSVVELTDFGVGPEPILGYLAGGIPAKPLHAAPVNGKRTHWIYRPGSGYGGKLRWQYGPDRWAEISVQGAADDTGTIYRIARSITFGTAKPTAFPFQIKGLPADLKVYMCDAGPGLGGSGYSAGVSFAAGAYSMNNGLEISVTAAGLMARRFIIDPGRRITVEGHRALDRRSTTGGVARHTLIVSSIKGFDISIQASGQTLRRLEATGGVTGLYRRITVLGTTPSRWTTAPLG